MLHQLITPQHDLRARLKRFCFAWICAVSNLALFVGFVAWRDSSYLLDGLELLGYFTVTFPFQYLALAQIVQVVRGPQPTCDVRAEAPSLSEVSDDR